MGPIRFGRISSVAVLEDHNAICILPLIPAWHDRSCLVREITPQIEDVFNAVMLHLYTPG